MSDHRDELDAWLAEPVQPLLPPPGTFERIKKRARWRKAARAAGSVAAAAVVVLGAAVTPRLFSQFTHGSRLTSGLAGPGLQHHAPAVRSPSPRQTASLGTSGSVTTPATPAAAARDVFSVTFVGKDTGWVLVAAARNRSGPSLARTDNAGGTWHPVQPSPTGPASAPSGVSQIRFLNTTDGWAFGPRLWATHDSGATWTPVNTMGLRVTMLEARNTRVFAVWARCHGTAVNFAIGCTSFSLHSAAAADPTNQWSKVPGAPSLGSAVPASATLVLTASQDYLLGPRGQLLTGLAAGTGRWMTVTRAGRPVTAPCSPGAPSGGAQPSQALFAATGRAQGLILLCLGQPVGDSQAKALWYSPDGGRNWLHYGSAPLAGVATSLSGTLACGAVLATSQGIDTAATVGGAWRPATVASPPAGGFTYVGMTTPSQGVAIPANPNEHAVWITRDRGSLWVRSPV